MVLLTAIASEENMKKKHWMLSCRIKKNSLLFVM